jgi:hypothetical protein
MPQGGSNKKKSVNRHYFCHEKNSNDLFRTALYGLMLVLHKDSLFHCLQFFKALCSIMATLVATTSGTSTTKLFYGHN